MTKQEMMTMRLSDMQKTLSDSLNIDHPISPDAQNSAYQVTLGRCFPICQNLLGTDCFKSLAHAFSRKHTHESIDPEPMLSDFPAFLNTFKPLAALPYIADLAALENQLRHTYHLPSQAFPISAVGDIHGDMQRAVRYLRAPGSLIFHSQYPIDVLWHMTPQASLDLTPEDRYYFIQSNPGFDPTFEAIDRNAFDLLNRFEDGLTLGKVISSGQFDFSVSIVLHQLIQQEKITHFIVEASA